MNINEVLYLPVKREGLSIGPDKFFCKRRYRTLDGDEVASSFKAKTKEELLGRQKPEVPQFVAEWLEGLKKEFPDNLPNQLYHVTRQGWGNGLEYKDSKTKEMKTLYNCGGKIKKDLVNALIYGYTIEKEKLYTVEIPNPNREGRGHAKFVLERQGNKVFLVKRKSKDYYYNKNSNHLTEPEIRKDFDWAWQFAKEVTE